MEAVLYKEQQPIADDIFARLGVCELFNIPTGRGKTFILLDVAKRVIKEKKKKVIISVPNNYLVREMHQVARKSFGFTQKKCGIRIGADNYIDINRLKIFLDTVNFEEYFEKSDVAHFLQKHKNSEDLFFDDFFKAVPLKDAVSENVVKYSICRLSGSKSDDHFKDLTITNHYYLLAKSMYDKNFDIGEYTLLTDEVHELPDVAEQIMTDSFSLYEYKNILNTIKNLLKKEADYHGKIKAITALQNQEVKAYRILKNCLSPNLVGQYISSSDEVREIRNKCKKLLSTSDHNYIKDRVAKKMPDYVSFFTKTNSFISSLNKCEITTNNILYGVYYSPSKGYPTLRTSSGNPMGKINVLFWGKVNTFAGVSGSTTCSFSPTNKEIKYGYIRLGMAKENESRSIHFYDRIFPRANITVHLPKPSFYEGIKKETVFSEDFAPGNSPYYEKIINFVHSNQEGKNTIVLCGGYRECEYLSSIYLSKFKERNVLYSNKKEKVYQTIEKFKSQGGVLFATKNYGVGTSLEGELLEKLFIIKLPYADFTTKKWQDIKNKSMGMFARTMEREMLITYIQNLGRVPRTKDDKGDIYLLDYGYTKIKGDIKNKIIAISREYGTLSTELNTDKKQEEAEINTRMESLFS